MPPDLPTSDSEQSTYLVVTFDAPSMPPGTVDANDLTDFLSGLQDVAEALLRYDYPTHRHSSEDLSAIRFIVLSTEPGSYRCYFILKSIFDQIAPLIHNILTNEELHATIARFLAEGAATEVGKRLMGFGIDHTRRMIGFLRNVTSNNPKPESSELLDKTAPGLKKIAAVGGKAHYQQSAGGALLLGTDVPSDEPIKFNRNTNISLIDFLEGEGSEGGIHAIYGKATQIDTKEKVVRLTVPGVLQRIECRYHDPIAGTVLVQAIPNRYVIAVGVPHYRKGSDGSWPPRYIHLVEIKTVDTDPGWRVRRIDTVLTPQVNHYDNHSNHPKPQQRSLW